MKAMTCLPRAIVRATSLGSMIEGRRNGSEVNKTCPSFQVGNGSNSKVIGADNLFITSDWWSVRSLNGALGVKIFLMCLFAGGPLRIPFRASLFRIECWQDPSPFRSTSPEPTLSNGFRQAGLSLSTVSSSYAV